MWVGIWWNIYFTVGFDFCACSSAIRKRTKNVTGENERETEKERGNESMREAVRPLSSLFHYLFSPQADSAFIVTLYCPPSTCHHGNQRGHPSPAMGSFVLTGATAREEKCVISLELLNVSKNSASLMMFIVQNVGLSNLFTFEINYICWKQCNFCKKKKKILI